MPFGEQLAEQSRPAHAERDANGDLATPADGARQQQVGDVGAGDQQHDERDAAQPRGGARHARRLRAALGEHRRGDARAAASAAMARRAVPVVLRLIAPPKRVGEVGARRGDR